MEQERFWFSVTGQRRTDLLGQAGEAGGRGPGLGSAPGARPRNPGGSQFLHVYLREAENVNQGT